MVHTPYRRKMHQREIFQRGIYHDEIPLINRMNLHTCVSDMGLKKGAEFDTDDECESDDDMECKYGGFDE